MEEIKLIAIVSWIFCVSDFLRLFMIFFKYGLILSKYFSTDPALYPSPLALYLIYLLLQKLLTLTRL